MNNEIVQKGSLMSLAMLAVASGISLVTQGNMPGGTLLVVVGFGFVMWREYLKMHYQNMPRKKR